ncbi:MAG: hypothetical protein H7123_05805, partial [Thermoleophilia bacterium]|nr:hypothetical protein [Thermoleophilia bacterium]
MISATVPRIASAPVVTPVAAAPVAPAVTPVSRPVAGAAAPVGESWGEIPKPSYFRSYDQVRKSLTELADQHPDLLTVETVGPSTDTAAGKADRPLFAVTAGAQLPEGVTDTRPVLAIVAGVHADESANPEFMARTIEDLVKGYGTDAQATHLLRTRRIVVVPFANPDGRAAVEQGFATNDAKLINQRRSGSNGGGVDLNRNF